MFTSIWNFIKKWPKTTIFTLLVLLGFGTAIAFLVQPKPPEYITENVKRGDLRQIVEAIGTVTSERDLKLQFPITGIIDRVNVKEGDIVKAGTELARLRSSGLASDIASANASVAAAQADLQTVEAGTRPEEIAITEASIANKRASVAAAEESLRAAMATVQQSEEKLKVLESEVSTSLQGSVDTIRSSVSNQLSSLLTSIAVVDGVLHEKIMQDAYIKNDPAGFSTLETQIQSLRKEVMSLQSKFSTIAGYSSAIQALESIRSTAERVSYQLTSFYSFVSSVQETQYLTSSVRESYKSTIAAQRTSVQSALASIDASLQSLRNVPANNQTRIAAEEAQLLSAKNAEARARVDIESVKTALQIEEANLRLKQAGNRPGDIAAAKARLNQAYASLQRANERYSDTVIRAPIDGMVTKVNLKAGELLSTSFASESAITMLGTAAYRVEMYVPEIDIPKVRVGMSGSIVLDAFINEPFSLRVSELDPTSTQVDNVSKYRAVLDFTEPEKVADIKIGMTGNAEIQTNIAKDVLQVPARAVRRNAEGFEVIDVLQPDGTIAPVSIATGLEGEGGYLEVISGLSEGQTIIVLTK